MRPRIGMFLLFFVASFLALGGCDSGSKRGKEGKSGFLDPQFPVAQTSGTAFCYLAGSVRENKKSASEQNAFGGLVRLKFDVSESASCVEQATRWCQERLKTGVTPENLVLSFRARPDAETGDVYEVTEKCTLNPKGGG